jgi:putative ABC transport system substrate-binding protein
VWNALKRSAAGVSLILAASLVLLLSDWSERKAVAAAASRTAVAATTSAAPRVFKTGIVYFSRDIGTDLCVQGLIDGLRAGGLEEGKNLEVRRADAQGEMANIAAILQNYDNSDLDLIMTISTPCLTGACNGVKHKPVVFTCVADPIAAGAAKTRRDHLPFLTGTGSFPPVDHLLDLVERLIPGVQAVGVMYNPAEANSVRELEVARKLFQSRVTRLEEVAISSSSEVFQAGQILAGRNIQALWLPGDNTAIQGFEGAVKASLDTRLPLFTDDCDSLERGALACLGTGAHPAGLASGRLAARVLLGANPKDLPIEEVAVEEIAVNHKIGAQFGITFPPDLVRKARP